MLLVNMSRDDQQETTTWAKKLHTCIKFHLKIHIYKDILSLNL